MLAGDPGTTDFESVLSNSSDTMIYDDSSGDLTKSALVGWVDLSISGNPVFTGKVYIIERDYNDDGGSLSAQQLASSGWDKCFTKYPTIILDDYGNPYTIYRYRCTYKWYCWC